MAWAPRWATMSTRGSWRASGCAGSPAALEGGGEPGPLGRHAAHVDGREARIAEGRGDDGTEGMATDPGGRYGSTSTSSSGRAMAKPTRRPARA